MKKKGICSILLLLSLLTAALPGYAQPADVSFGWGDAVTCNSVITEEEDGKWRIKAQTLENSATIEDCCVDVDITPYIIMEMEWRRNEPIDWALRLKADNGKTYEILSQNTAEGVNIINRSGYVIADLRDIAPELSGTECFDLELTLFCTYNVIVGSAMFAKEAPAFDDISVLIATDNGYIEKTDKGVKLTNPASSSTAWASVVKGYWVDLSETPYLNVNFLAHNNDYWDIRIRDLATGRELNPVAGTSGGARGVNYFNIKKLYEDNGMTVEPGQKRMIFVQMTVTGAGSSIELSDMRFASYIVDTLDGVFYWGYQSSNAAIAAVDGGVAVSTTATYARQSKRYVKLTNETPYLKIKLDTVYGAVKFRNVSTGVETDLLRQGGPYNGVYTFDLSTLLSDAEAAYDLQIFAYGAANSPTYVYEVRFDSEPEIDELNKIMIEARLDQVKEFSSSIESAPLYTAEQKAALQEKINIAELALEDEFLTESMAEKAVAEAERYMAAITDTKIDYIYIENGAVNAKATITDSELTEAVFIVAVYDGDGKLVNVKAEYADVVPGTTTAMENNGLECGTGCTAKAMLWTGLDGDGAITPLTYGKEVLNQ